jgi:hypothetical protein
MKAMREKVLFVFVLLIPLTSGATTPRYTVSGADKDMVADGVTGLVWQVKTTSDALDWKAALAYCEALKQGGQEDWRLPDVLELFTIIDERKSEPPAINEHVFQGFQAASGLWTSTSGRRDGNSAYAVYFNEQNATVGRGGSGLLVKTAKAVVLCVRGGTQ